MPSITYTALRDFYPGHAQGESYEIIFTASELTPKKTTVSDDHVTLSGKVISVHHRVEKYWTVTTDMVHETELQSLLWNEFFGSVERRETFLFSPNKHSSLDKGDFYQTVLWGDPGFSRVGASNYFNITFTVRVI